MGNGKQDQETIRRSQENALYESQRRLYNKHRAKLCKLFGVKIEEEEPDEESEEDEA